MSNKIYPAIYQNSHGVVVLSYSDDLSVVMSELNKGEIHQPVGFKRNYINVTTEYLNSTCGKVESPEHAEFIADLCEVNGIGRDSWIDGVIYFYVTDNELYFTNRANVPDDGLKQITIPMPPKKQEWPKIGDKVDTESGLSIVKLPPDTQGYYVVETIQGENTGLYMQYQIDGLSKPKTEDEILRDEIGAILDSYVMSDKVKSHFVDELINITKKSAMADKDL